LATLITATSRSAEPNASSPTRRSAWRSASNSISRRSTLLITCPIHIKAHSTRRPSQIMPLTA